MKAITAFCTLVLVCGSVSLASAQSVDLKPAARSLADALGEMHSVMGAELLLAPNLAHDLVSGDAQGAAGHFGVQELLAGYNYGVVHGADGQINRIIVSGRHGSGETGKHERQRVVNPSPGDDLLIYEPSPGAIPKKYQGLRSGSVSAVRIPSETLRGMPLGGKLVLSLPMGQYTVVHDNAFHHDNGDMTWVGYLERPGRNYRVIVTLGAAGSLGQIVTPEGIYQLGLEEDRTWLVDVNQSGMQAGSLATDEGDGSLLSSAAPLPAQSPLSAAGVVSHAPRNHNTERNAQNVPGGGSAAAGTPLENTVDQDSVIDVMIVYTRGMAAQSVRTRLNFLVASANQAYLDSGIHLQLRLVKSVRVKYTDDNENSAALNELTLGTGVFKRVARLRRKVGADLVSLIRPFRYGTQISCGTAWVNGARGDDLSAGLGYSVVSDGSDPTGWYCSDYTLAHELGHNLGSVHDSEHSSLPGKYAFSNGYGIDGRFGTIMSYFNPVLGLFSSPRLMCEGVITCGTTDGADNSRSIGLTAPIVAGFMPTRR